MSQGEQPIEAAFKLEQLVALNDEMAALVAKTNPLKGKPGVYRPSDKLLAFLNSL